MTKPGRTFLFIFKLCRIHIFPVQKMKSTLAIKSGGTPHRKSHFKRRLIDQQYALKPSAGPLSMKTRCVIKVLQVNLSLYPLSLICVYFPFLQRKIQLVSQVLDSLNKDKWLVNTGLSLFETK